MNALRSPWFSFGGWKEFLHRILWAKGSPLPEAGSRRLPVLPVLREAWKLFMKLNRGHRWRLMGAYLVLSLAVFVRERMLLGGGGQEFGSWTIHFLVSIWALSLFLPSPFQKKSWWQSVPELILYALIFEWFCQLVWLLVFYGSVVTGILVGGLLPTLQIPPLFGKVSPDLLMFVFPALLFLGAGGAFLWFLLGFSFVIPLILQRGAGLWPATVSSLDATRGNRVAMLLLFVLVALILGLPLFLVSIGKGIVAVLPFSALALVPPSPLGVWICFGLQTGVLVAGTILSIYIWPLGSALWAALYRCRYLS